MHAKRTLHSKKNLQNMCIVDSVVNRAERVNVSRVLCKSPHLNTLNVFNLLKMLHISGKESAIE